MDFYGRTTLVVLFILSCAGLVQSCACSRDVKQCANIYQMPADFHTSEVNCRTRGGRLSIQSNASEEFANFLLDNTIGNIWIGLHAPRDECSRNTSTGEGTAEFTNWENEDASCVPLCVSVSSDKRRTVRPCTDKLDGFLCVGLWGDICKESAIILDNTRCMYAPCEQICSPLETGYRCSCMERFRPNGQDPRRCDFYCATAVCDALCIRGASACWCPDGFVRSEQSCEDIDECESNHDCAQMCVNTIGSYRCACYDPFIVVNKTECTLNPNLLKGHVSNAPSNYIAHGGLSTPWEYVGLIILLVVAIFALLALVYYLRARKAAVQECNPPDFVVFQGRT